MPPHQFFDPVMFGVEFAYSIFVVIICLLIYIKTKSVYELTKHKGIQYFRNAFLFFGLAYIARFMAHLFKITNITFEFFIPMREIWPYVLMVTGYLSTIAIFYLIYSTIWEKIGHKQFLIFSNTIAIILAIIPVIFRSHLTLAVAQIILLLLAIVLNIIYHKKSSKHYQTKALYFLILIFWLFNLALIGPGRLIPHELKIIFQVISFALFLIIYYKVNKWIK
ncbi:hypothetical protein ACFLZX_01365 [Nanoarchaeota archaeon]